MSDEGEDQGQGQALTLVQTLASLELAAGGRAEIAATLEAAPGDRFELLAGLLADPGNDGRSLAQLCKSVGLSVREFMTTLRDARYTRTAVEIGLKIAEKLPAVADDIVSRAVPHYLSCDMCDGSGVAPGAAAADVAAAAAAEPEIPPASVRCLGCKGKGQILVLPELARQKLALELGGVLKQGMGPGVNVGVIVNNPGAQAPGTSPAFRGKTDRLLWDDKARESLQPVDVEASVVEEPGEESGDE